MAMNWTTSSENTNPAAYNTNCLSPYLSGQIKVYKCPADKIPSSNGDRIRSIFHEQPDDREIFPPPSWSSLETYSYIAGWKFFVKMTDLAALQPVNAWIFADEQACSHSTTAIYKWASTRRSFPDVPANYHNGINLFFLCRRACGNS